VQTFYQLLFSNSSLAILFPSAVFFPSAILSSAILLQPFIFPFSASSLFPSKASHIQKAKSPKPKSQKWFAASFSESFTPSGKQGDGALRDRHDIVTRETCVPTSLKVNNLGKAAVLHFSSSVAGAVPILAYR
jgi:hypothetical protein